MCGASPHTPTSKNYVFRGSHKISKFREALNQSVIQYFGDDERAICGLRPTPHTLIYESISASLGKCWWVQRFPDI